MTDILKRFIEAGLPVIPLKKDKEPLFSQSFLGNELPKIDDPRYTSIGKCDYFGLMCGNKQTRLECIDVDLKHVGGRDGVSDADARAAFWERFKGSIPKDIWSQLYVEQSPSGGYHLIYSCDGVVPGSTHLAYVKGEKSPAIETRGSGGYVMVYPSRGVKVVQGDIFAGVCNLTDDQIDHLKSVARMMNEQPEKTTKRKPSTAIQRVYNQKHTGEVLAHLESKGWVVARDKDDRIWLTRPGKTKGVSATLYKTSGYLYVFTSSTEFDVGRAYSPFEIMREARQITTEDLEREASEEVGEKYIRDLINEIQRNKDKLPVCDMRRVLTNTIVKDMEKHGKFYHDELYGYYFVDNRLIRINLDGDEFYKEMFRLYGMIKIETDYRFVFEGLKNYSMVYGERTQIFFYCHFSGASVYVDNFDGTLWKIDDKDVKQLPNGTDGILFMGDGTPVIYDSKDVKPRELFFRGVNFDENGLSAENYKDLFFLWMMSIYFLDTNKPMACVTGPPGSGKSFVFKKMLYMMFGNASALKLMPEKSADFFPMVTNNKISVLDNVDSYKPWVQDALASCATGGTVSIRKLYTTNEEYEIPLRCFIGITTAAPSFNRNDIADRLILFETKRYEKFIPENGIISEIMANRNQFMTEIFKAIKVCLRAIRGPDVLCITRMADFENFARKINPKMEVVFENLKLNQKEFSVDPFTDLFFEYCKEQEVTTIERTSSELSIQLMEKGKEIGMKDFRLSSHKVAIQMKNTFDFCIVEKVKTGHANKSFYRINISCPIKGEVKDAGWDR